MKSGAVNDRNRSQPLNTAPSWRRDVCRKLSQLQPSHTRVGFGSAFSLSISICRGSFKSKFQCCQYCSQQKALRGRTTVSFARRFPLTFLVLVALAILVLALVLRRIAEGL